MFNLIYYWWSPKQAEIGRMSIKPRKSIYLPNGIQYSQLTRACRHETHWDDIEIVSIRIEGKLPDDKPAV